MLIQRHVIASARDARSASLCDVVYCGGGGMVGWLFGWLVGWLFGRVINWLAGWPGW